MTGENQQFLMNINTRKIQGVTTLINVKKTKERKTKVPKIVITLQKVY